MARKTFGPSGSAIVIPDDDFGTVDDEVIQPTVIDDHTGTDVNFIRVTGDGNGETGDETGSDSGEAGSRTTYADPASATSPRTGRPKRVYTRRARTATASAATDTSATDKATFITGNLEKVLFNAHARIADFTGMPQIRRSATDCAMLAEALKDVAEAQEIQKIIDPKWLAWIQLVVVLIIVYFGDDIAQLIFGKKQHGNITVMPPAQAGD